MAVYWLDPYIDANIGGIHGTLDTTTRDGTYSYPFGLRDFIGSGNTTSTLTGGNKQSLLANGDELRIKGLANWTDFCIDLGSNWYYDGNYLRDNVGTENSDITSYLSSHPISYGSTGYHWPFMYDPNDTDPFTQPGPYSSNGYNRKPCIIGVYYRYSTSQWAPSYSTQYGDAGTRYTILRSKAYNTSNTTKMYMISPEYMIPTDTSSQQNYYVFSWSGSNYFTITDGWTSETVRDGVNIINIVGGYPIVGYYNHAVNFCGQTTSTSASYEDEHSAFLNTPNTHWVNLHFTTTSYPYSASQNILYGCRNGYTGSRYIIKPGSFTNSPYSNYGININVATNFYSSSGGFNTTGSNSVDFTYVQNLSMNSYYSQYHHTVIRNLSVSVNGYINAYNYYRFFTFGSIFMYDGASSSANWRLIFASNNSLNAGSWIKMLANSHYLHGGGNYANNNIFAGNTTGYLGPYVDSIGQGYDSGTGLPPLSSTYGSEAIGALTQDRDGAVIYNYTNESAGILSAYPNLTTYVSLPNILTIVTSNANAIKTNIDTSNPNWWGQQGIQISDFENAVNDASNHLVVTLGNLITGNKSITELTGVPILTGTLNSYTSPYRSQDITFSSSSKDNKTVHMMLPYNDDGGLSFAPIVYNDITGNLIIQSNYRNNDIFSKTIPVPIASDYVSGSSLRGIFKFKFETVSGTGINSNSSSIIWHYKNQSGNLVSISSVNLYTSNTTETTVTNSFGSTNVAYDSFSPNHMLAEIRFYNYTGGDSADCGRLIITDLYTETY
jgi:hypothetical protein